MSASPEDVLPCLHNSKADPLIRSRPLSDIYPFQSHADKSAAPYLLSGCGAQIQPMIAGPSENRLNGINSSAWSNPVIGQPEGKPHASRIMKLFSNSKKGPVPAHSPTTDSSSSTHSSSSSSNGGPQSWSGLSGLGVVDSFKKLRSSVLQGIQSRGTISNAAEHVPSLNQDMAAGTNVANIDPGPDQANNHLKFTEEYSESNDNYPDENVFVMRQCESDIEDYYDDEDNDGDGLTRNTRFSRSIRRAYGAGRISLFDLENERRSERSMSETADSQKQNHTSEGNVQSEKMSENINVNVLSRLSRSAENLHIFKAPFRRKAPSPGPSSPGVEPQLEGTTMPHKTPNIQRTASVSSVDLQDHAISCRKSPVKTKGPMLKLVGSMTDLTVRRRRSPSPSLMSPLSRLHDDYSRRIPCLATSERQPRPSPVRARVLSVGHTPLAQLQPEYNVNPQQHQVLISPISVEQTSPGNSTHYESLTVATSASECDSTPLNEKEASQQQQELPEVTMLPNEVSE